MAVPLTFLPLLRNLVAMVMLSCTPSMAAQHGKLTDLSLEELSQIEVTSVSRQKERLADAAASVYIITSDAIQRSGVATLPEALGLAPNLQVARVDARNYAISARGFNDVFANKLLVMIDGRTIYTPLFSGVFWDAQDLVLEDIERIEVVSGPGGTMWGANAVNGVINIITRSSADTQGHMARVRIGEQKKNAVVRYGGSSSSNVHYRVYGSVYDQDDERRVGGESDLFGMKRAQAGFRIDWTDHADDYTVQGDAYQGKLHQQGTDDIEIAGWNLLARWQHPLSDTSNVHVQTYLDRTQRDQPLAFSETLDTLAVELQHTFQPVQGHTAIWGASYRSSHDDIVPTGDGFAFLPANERLYWSSIFIQDEIALSDSLRLTVGEKLEKNNYTKIESMPNIRLAWKPAKQHMLWGALSRAIRAPSRIDRDFYAPVTPPYVIAGGPAFTSEVANIAEMGYRGQPWSTVSYSATFFYHDYKRLRGARIADGSMVFANNYEGDIRGVEMWASWQVKPGWRLDGGWVLQDQRVQPLEQQAFQLLGLGSAPHHYWSLRSSFQLGDAQDLDIRYRRTGAVTEPGIPAYGTLDVNLGWKLNPTLQFMVSAHNVLDNAHVEHGSPTSGTEFGRELFLKMVYGL